MALTHKKFKIVRYGVTFLIIAVLSWLFVFGIKRDNYNDLQYAILPAVEGSSGYNSRFDVCAALPSLVLSGWPLVAFKGQEGCTASQTYQMYPIGIVTNMLLAVGGGMVVHILLQIITRRKEV